MDMFGTYLSMLHGIKHLTDHDGDFFLFWNIYIHKMLTSLCCDYDESDESTGIRQNECSKLLDI